MSLLNVVEQGVETAFAVASEFVTIGTYIQHVGGSTYDPETDAVTPGVVEIPNVRFLKTASEGSEREASPISVTDVKFIIPAKDLPAGFRPREEDQMLPGDGLKYNLVVPRFVPGNPVHIIFARQA